MGLNRTCSWIPLVRGPVSSKEWTRSGDRALVAMGIPSGAARVTLIDRDNPDFSIQVKPVDDPP